MKVYTAINNVQKAICAEGIAKDRKNQMQGYTFRGIDDVYNTLSPILANNGLCILPRMLSRQCVERVSQKGGNIFYVTVEAEFDFVAAEDGSKHTIKTYGEAMDSADKATNKAMSAAYKYAAFQAFAIPTEGDNDADAHTPQVLPKKSVQKTETKKSETDKKEDIISDYQLAVDYVNSVKSSDELNKIYRLLDTNLKRNEALLDLFKIKKQFFNSTDNQEAA